MARPFKSGVDYFPLDVVMDDKVELLEAEHGIIGFGVYIKLYQKVYANNYWVNWDNKSVIVFSSRINVDINSVNAIINSCLEWGIFDKKLFEKFSILTSRGIQKRFFEITQRRRIIEVVKEFLLLDLPKKENSNLVIVNINRVNVYKSTQRKGKERKGKNKEITFSEEFIKLWTDYPNTKGSKTQTFKNYQTTKKSLLGEQIYSACMNSTKKQEEDKSLPFQLSNLVGQKYRADLKELLNYKSPVDEEIRLSNEKRQKEVDRLNAESGPAFGGPHGKAY